MRPTVFKAYEVITVYRSSEKVPLGQKVRPIGFKFKRGPGVRKRPMHGMCNRGRHHYNWDYSRTDGGRDAFPRGAT